MITRRSICVAALAALLPFAAFGQAYPSKTIRLVVPFPAGGGTDATGRVLANRLTATMGQTVIVENRTGAGGMIGTDYVAKSAPDGYTLLLAPASFTVDPALRKLPYDPKKDLVPVSLVMTGANVLVVNSSSTYKSIKDLIEDARARPGTLSYASAGAGTGQHLSGELFNVRTKANLLHVPYKGGGPALADLIGGQVTCYFANAASATPHIKSGRLRALGITSAVRSPYLPDVPTFKEQGIPDYEVLEWAGILVPAGTPEPIVERLAKEIQDATQDPEVRAKLAGIGVIPAGSSPAVFSKFLNREMTGWADLIKANNIKID